MAECLLTAAVLRGDSFDINTLRDDDLDRAIEAVNLLINEAWDQYDSFEKLHSAQNNDTIRNQEQYLRRTTAKKIEGYQDTLVSLRLGNKNERVIRMWEGRIKRATEVMEEQIRRLNSKFNCPITCGDGAVGMLVIRE